MPEGSEQKESPAEDFLDRLGKAEDFIGMFAKDGGPAILQGFRQADAVLGFYVGSVTAALDAANPHNDALTRVVSAIQVPVGIAAKYEAVHGLLVHSAVEDAAVGGYTADITLGSFLATPAAQVALLIAEFKTVYSIGQWADAKYHLSDRGSDWAIRYTHADHLDPVKYPMTTIYDYLAHNLPMPPEIHMLVAQGLIDQGRTWPEFSQYPLYLQHQLTERVADTLGNMFHAVGAAAHEMEPRIFHDVRADQGHHDVPAAHANGEPAAPSVTPPVHYGPPAPGPQSDARPVSVHLDSPAASADRAAPAQGQQLHFGVGLVDDHAPAGLHSGPLDHPVFLGVGLVDDHAPSGLHSGPPTHLVFLGVGLVDEHGHGTANEANPHHAGPGDGAGPAGDGHPAADMPHVSAHQDAADANYQPDHGGADDPADFHGS